MDSYRVIKLFYYDDLMRIGMKDDSIILKAFFLQLMLKHYENHQVRILNNQSENLVFFSFVQKLYRKKLVKMNLFSQ
jgi:hypothetical protein